QGGKSHQKSIGAAMEVEDILALVAGELANVHTCLPGKIIAYDGKFATVQPTLDKQLANGQTLAAPQIVNVPLCWTAGDGGSALITVPLKPGDDVLLHFSERALENWLGGSNQAPDDPRIFDLSDAFASPMLRPTVGAADTQNVVVQYKKTSMKIMPNGDILISGPGTMTVDMLAVFKKLVTYQAGMVGGGGSGSTMTIVGNLAHSGGVITSTAVVQDGHRHNETGSVTGGPI